MSKIAMQQEALDQLQAGLVDELESKGTFQDPETQKIMEKYQMVPEILFTACIVLSLSISVSYEDMYCTSNFFG